MSVSYYLKKANEKVKIHFKVYFFICGYIMNNNILAVPATNYDSWKYCSESIFVSECFHLPYRGQHRLIIHSKLVM